MSKIERLIEELCPDGVEYVKFKDTCQYIRGITYKKSQEANNNNDVLPWKVLRANNITLSSNKLNFNDVKFVKHEVKVKSEQILKTGDILICAGSGSKEHVGKVAYIMEDMDYTFGGFMAVIRCNKSLKSRFLFHILTSGLFSSYLSFALNSTTINNLNSSVISNFTFPFPPLPIQEEIVRILDSFTEKTNELKAQLEEELEARKKQYEWYRDMLLKKNKVQIVKLGEICDLKAGATPKTSVKDYWEKGTIPWMSSGEVNLKKVYKTEKTITQKGYNNCSTKLIPENSVIVALAGQGKTRGTVAMNMIPLCTNQSLCALICRDVINPYYLYYYLQTQYDNLRYISSGNGNRGGLNLKMLESYMIPLPPLEEQQRIVDILDRFDKLCNDISEGLLAEIDARQKQYEYYRDKLLTFKRLEDREGIENERV